MGLFHRSTHIPTEPRHRAAPEAHVADGLIEAEMAAVVWGRRERRFAKIAAEPAAA